jgi:SAM-dependent methyltransferase
VFFAVKRILGQADRLFAAGSEAEAFAALRRLSVKELGRVLLDGAPGFPALQAALPVMPPEQVQRDWTGSSGRALLAQTSTFVMSLERAYRGTCGRPLEDAVILDYGCGWGRILRLMLRFADPSRLYGVDPWPASLEASRASRVRGHLAPCDEVPGALPFPGVTFDLVYAFSVFTHLSEKTATAVLAALRPRLAPQGLLVLTVRPPEYWRAHAGFPAGTDAETMIRRHREQGFAFIPHVRAPLDGDVTFGDTSIALDYVRRSWTDWHLAGTETNRADPYQLLLFLRPR